MESALSSRGAIALDRRAVAKTLSAFIAAWQNRPLDHLNTPHAGDKGFLPQSGNMQNTWVATDNVSAYSAQVQVLV
jgi:hypothetical protein